MATYSMEDIELIRRKSGITYEEAVSMLDYHNGDVARVLIDLEKNGRLHEVNTTRTQAPQTDSNKKGGKFMNFIQKMIRTRIKVRKGDTLIINLSVLFVVAAALLMGDGNFDGFAAEQNQFDIINRGEFLVEADVRTCDFDAFHKLFVGELFSLVVFFQLHFKLAKFSSFFRLIYFIANIKYFILTKIVYLCFLFRLI